MERFPFVLSVQVFVWRQQSCCNGFWLWYIKTTKPLVRRVSRPDHHQTGAAQNTVAQKVSACMLYLTYWKNYCVLRNSGVIRSLGARGE